MTEQQFIEEFKSILDTEYDIEADTELSDIDEWDSLAAMSLFTFLKDEFDVTTNIAALMGIKQFSGILNLVKDKLS
jgi:acyl carrier protein